MGWKKLLHDEFVLKRVSVNMEKVAVNKSTEMLEKPMPLTNKLEKPYRQVFIKHLLIVDPIISRNYKTK